MTFGRLPSRLGKAQTSLALHSLLQEFIIELAPLLIVHSSLFIVHCPERIAFVKFKVIVDVFVSVFVAQRFVDVIIFVAQRFVDVIVFLPHPGNELFPPWVCNVPSLGINDKP